VKNADVTELMAFLGLFGAIIAAIQISIFERGAVRAIQWSTEAVSMLLHSLSISANRMTSLEN